MDEVYVWCDDCDGTGVDAADQLCKKCDGSGEIEVLPDERHGHECDSGACYC